MFNVGSIVGELVLKDQFSGELKSAEQTSAKASKNLSMQLAAVSAAAVAMGAAMLAAAKATANYRDETTKAARRAGMTVEEFSQLRHAAELSGIQFNELAISMSKLASPEAGKRLERLGITMTNLDGTAKSNADIFDEVADKVAQAGTASEKTRIAVAAFGEEGSKMVSMLENGSAGLAEMRQEAIDLGIAFDEEAGKQAELFNDNLDRLSKSVQGVRDSLGQAVIEFINSTGIVEDLTDIISEAAKAFNSLDDTAKETIVFIGAMTVAFGVFVGGIIAFQAIAPAIGAAFTVAFGPAGIAIMATVAAVTALTIALKANKTEAQDSISTYRKTESALSGIDLKLQRLAKASKDSAEYSALHADTMATLVVEAKQYGIQIDDTNLSLKEMRDLQRQIREEARLALEYEFGQIESALADEFQRLSAEAPKFAELQRQMLNNQGQFVATLRQGVDAQLAGMDAIERQAYNMGLMNSQQHRLLRLSEDYLRVHKELARTPTPVVADPPSGSPGTKAFNQEAEKSILNISDMASSAKNMQGELSKMDPDLWGKMADGMQEVADFGKSKVMGALRDLANGYMDMLNAVTEATQAKLQRNSEIYDTIGQLQLNQMKKRHEEELSAIDNRYDAEIQALQEASLERRLLEDNELAEKKARLERELAAELEKERILFEKKKEFLMEESADRQQANLAGKVMEDDWSKYVEKRRQDMKNQLIEEERKSGNEVTKIESETQTKITQLQEQKATEREKLQQRQEEEEKAHTKRMALIQYAFELFAYEAQKKAAIAAAGMKFAESIMSAVQAGASLAAVFPPITAPLGIALTASLIAMSTVAYNASIASINAQKPLPPPSLFMQEGGTVQGRLHSQGGVPAELEHGEMVVSRADTTRLRDMMNRDEQYGRGGVIVSQGAIVIYNYGTMDDAAVDKISSQVAERIEQRRF